MLEKVQHRFTRTVPGMKELPYKGKKKQNRLVWNV